MKNRILSLLPLLLLFFVTSAPATAQNNMSDKSIAEVAMGNDNFSTLVTALKTAGLDKTMMEEGSYTVFAPTNDAFDKLPAGLVDALLLPKNRKTLSDILTFHVLDSKVKASDVMAGIKSDNSGRFIATTMNGNLTLTNRNGNVMVKGEQGRTATVTGTDIMASNGIIHSIDNVLLPEGVDVAMIVKNAAKQVRSNATNTARDMRDNVNATANQMKEDGKEMMNETRDAANRTMDNVKQEGREMVNDARSTMNSTANQTQRSTRNMSSNATSGNYARAQGQTLVDVATSNGNFKSLTGAVKKAGLDSYLASQGEFTVFAPSDDAFGKLPSGTVEGLSDSQLKTVLSYHVIPAKLNASQLTSAIEANRGYYRLQTVEGKSLVASIENGNVVLTGEDGGKVTVTQTDVNSSNGTIHVIDGVLMPRS